MKINSIKRNDLLTKIVKFGLILLLGISISIMVVSVFSAGRAGEAPIGSFEAEDFNNGWTMTFEGNKTIVNLPMYVDSDEGDRITISNTLPNDLSNGMNLMTRASMEDIYIYIDGQLREKYASASIRGMGYFIPSAWIISDLNESDAGKTIEIQITVKNKGSLNEISLGYGNNAWFEVIKDGLPVAALAILELIAGICACLLAYILGKRYKMEATGYLGLLMVDVALWILSESTLRQLLFTTPSRSVYFSYLTLELLGPLACLYFDAVQHRVYHKQYLLIEGLVLIQITANLLLHTFGILEFFETMSLTHGWEVLCGLAVLIHLIIDIVKDRIKSYWISAIGTALFVFLSLMELVEFYIAKFRNHFGMFICIGLLFLLIFTLSQMVHDVLSIFREREKIREEMTNSTIETIAGAIDARDEYTGGHSERVGFYAKCLAREMADKYNLTDEDIFRVHYIGLVHDIGKIGVADSVLNKAGKLTSEEFSLMKRHTEIGYELMSSMGNQISGMLDGIRYHHERYDGTGYPDGLKGEDIPLVARVLCLADSYDAMTSNRVYRKRLTNEEVKEELIRCSGKQFDPELTKIFINLIDRGELREKTTEGMAANADGKPLNSAVLENRLLSDLLSNKKITHPSHVRMLCFIIKLIEKKGKYYRVMFIGPESKGETTESEFNSARRRILNTINANLKNHDLNVRYTDRLNVIALYERSDEELAEFKKVIMASYENTTIEDIL